MRSSHPLSFVVSSSSPVQLRRWSTTLLFSNHNLTTAVVFQTLLFQHLGLSDVTSRIIAAANGTEYFLASLIAIFLIDRAGRRKLMLFSAVGQCLTMVLLAVLGSVKGSGTQVVSAVLLFVFNSIFAIGWLGMTWLYVRPHRFSDLHVNLIKALVAC